MVKLINIGRDFSRYPAGRKSERGPYSGERFRNEFLLPPLYRGEKVVVELDDTAGYGSSFLEEAFGGLLRNGITLDQANQMIELVSDDPSLVSEIRGYMFKQSQRI